MPQFSEFDGIPQVSYITGPRHLLLAIDFVSEPVELIKVIKRPAVGVCKHGFINESELKETVVQVTTELNQQSKKYICPARIAYVESDSAIIELYAICTKLLYDKAIQKYSVI